MKTWKYVLLFIAIAITLIYVTYRPDFEDHKSEFPETVTSTENGVENDSQMTELLFCSDPWVPYAGHAGSENEGYIIDILRAIYEPLGYRVKYINAPWSRCVRNTRDGKFSALAGADFDEVPDFVFPKKSIGVTRPTFFTLKDRDWTYDDIESLLEIKLGGIQDYTYSEGVDKYLRQHQDDDNVLLVKGEDPLERLIKALEVGRIDAFVENAPVVYATIQRMGLDVNDFRDAGHAMPGVILYIPFSPKIHESRQYAEIFDRDIHKLRHTGQLDMILKHYNIPDWLEEEKIIKEAMSSEGKSHEE